MHTVVLKKQEDRMGVYLIVYILIRFTSLISQFYENGFFLWKCCYKCWWYQVWFTVKKNQYGQQKEVVNLFCQFKSGLSNHLVSNLSKNYFNQIYPVYCQSSFGLITVIFSWLFWITHTVSSEILLLEIWQDFKSEAWQCTFLRKLVQF